MPFRRRAFAVVALVMGVHAAILPSLPALAQSPAPRQTSEDLVTRGHREFDDQKYEESIQTLSAALLRPGSSKAQKAEIYRLLALNYITLSRNDEAEAAVRGLLTLEPSYALPESESPRFRDFFAAVRAKWEAEGRPGLVTEAVPPSPVAMKHASPSQAEPDKQLELTASLDDPGARVAVVRIFFRTGSKGRFSETDAVLSSGHARAAVPASAVRPPFVEYYLQGLDKGGLPVVSRGDASAPLRVAVPEPKRGWVLPVAIGAGVLGAAAVVGGLALAGVFKSSSSGSGSGNSTVTVTVGEAAWRHF